MVGHSRGPVLILQLKEYLMVCSCGVVGLWSSLLCLLPRKEGCCLVLGLFEDWGKIWRGILDGSSAGRMSVILLDGMLVNTLNLDALWEYVQRERTGHWYLRQLAAVCVMCLLSISRQTNSSWELQRMVHGGDEKSWFKPCIILMYLNYDKASLDTHGDISKSFKIQNKIKNHSLFAGLYDFDDCWYMNVAIIHFM